MPQIQLSTLVYIIFGILGIALLVDGAQSAGYIFKPCGTVITVTGLLLIVFDKWAWSFRFLHPWFVARPYIKGTWKGVLKSEYIDPKTGAPVPPIEVYLVIRQTYFTIHMRLLTKESSSETLAMEIPRAADGVYTVASIYRNTPRQDHRNHSPIHHGAMLIHVEGDPVIRLRAEYWTDRLTRGQIVFEELRKAIFFDFDSASKATYEDLAAAVSA
jgi:hypothetical protein